MLRQLSKGEARGEQKGRIHTWLTAVKNLMRSTKWTAEQAMEASGIPATEQKELKAKLKLHAVFVCHLAWIKTNITMGTGIALAGGSRFFVSVRA